MSSYGKINIFLVNFMVFLFFVVYYAFFFSYLKGIIFLFFSIQFYWDFLVFFYIRDCNSLLASENFYE
jgi:hypothetical protein